MAEGDGDRKASVGLGLPLTQEYAIVAVPDFASVTPGAVVRYVCLYKGGTEDYPRRLAPANQSTLRDYFVWYKFADSSLFKGGDGVFLQRGIDKKGALVTGPEWECEWTEKEGRYVIGCCIGYSRNRNQEKWCFLGQRVTEVNSVLAPMLGKARKNTAHPDQALEQAAQLIKTVKLAAEKFPNNDPAQKKSFDDYLKKLGDYQTKLQNWLKPTDGLVRYPIHAVHLAYVTQQKLQLNAFIAKVETEAAYREEMGDHRWRDHPEQQVWALVDWTDPTQPEICHRFKAKGRTNKDAIKNLFKEWDTYRNRYPEGQLMYDYQIGDLREQTSFETNGKTRWDIVSGLLGWIGLGALAVAGIATLLAPVPGSQVVSAAIWTSILSSTAAAAINIRQNLDHGTGTWKDFAFDGLTIVGNLLGGVGVIARTARGAQWAKGATLNLPAGSDPMLKVTRVTLIGQVGADGIQGILVAADAVEEYDRIMSDKTMAPGDRTERLLKWLRDLLARGAITVVSVRSTKKDLDALNQKNKNLLPGKKEGKTELFDDVTEEIKILDTEKLGTDPNHTATPKEKLDMLGDPTKELTLQKNVPVEGTTHTGKGKSKNKPAAHEEKLHKTKAETEPEWEEHTEPHRRRFTFDEKFPPDDIWRFRSFTDTEIVLVRKFPGFEGSNIHDLKFIATCKGGVIHVDIVSTYHNLKDLKKSGQDYLPPDGVIVKNNRVYTPELDAKELYPMMFDHFEEAAKRAGKSIKGIEGQFAFDNYRSFREALESGLSAEVALTRAKTWKYWQAYLDQYGYGLVPFRPVYDDGASVWWGFYVKEK